MKNISSQNFLDRFYVSYSYRSFILKYKTMKDCYDALLNGVLGDDSLELAICLYGHAVPFKKSNVFALWCAKRVEKYMKKETSHQAIKLMEQYIKKEIPFQELTKLGNIISKEEYDINEDPAVELLNDDPKEVLEFVSFSSINIGGEQEAIAQMNKLKELGNPFKEEVINEKKKVYNR